MEQSRHAAPRHRRHRPRRRIPLMAKLIAFAALVFLAVTVFLQLNGLFPSLPRVITTSSLMETINVSDLSTAQFTYKGIAQVYDSGNSAKVRCSILYHATVKAGINMEDVDFAIDRQQKVVRVTLPPITITSNTVDDSTLSFIPAGQTLPLRDALLACERDAWQEASETGLLIETAEANLKDTIQALLLPLLSNAGYTIAWQ